MCLTNMNVNPLVPNLTKKICLSPLGAVPRLLAPRLLLVLPLGDQAAVSLREGLGLVDERLGRVADGVVDE